VNRHQPLDEVWDRRTVDALADRLAHAPSAASAAIELEQALIAQLPGVAAADPIVEATVAAMSGAGPATKSVVSELIAEFGWSERTLRRHCHEAIGYGPKTLERILRFQRFLALADRDPSPDLATLALTAGYADQAHLTRESGRLAGLPPARLLAERAG
jgi:AraC-like DNA-binding protein